MPSVWSVWVPSTAGLSQHSNKRYRYHVHSSTAIPWKALQDIATNGKIVTQTPIWHRKRYAGFASSETTTAVLLQKICSPSQAPLLLVKLLTTIIELDHVDCRCVPLRCWPKDLWSPSEREFVSIQSLSTYSQKRSHFWILLKVLRFPSWTDHHDHLLRETQVPLTTPVRQPLIWWTHSSKLWSQYPSSHIDSPISPSSSGVSPCDLPNPTAFTSVWRPS